MAGTPDIVVSFYYSLTCIMLICSIAVNVPQYLIKNAKVAFPCYGISL